MTDRRIVSLLPSATEIVCELGLQDSLVGRSHECDFPPGVESLPICCRPAIDITKPSAVINEQVESRLQSALSVFEVDFGSINQLQPTHLLTQMQCEVCAVSERDVREHAHTAGGGAMHVVSLTAARLSDVWESILEVSRTLDATSAGDNLVARIRRDLVQLENKVASQPRPRVACVEWLDPLMTAGNWVPELVEIAGGENVLGTAGEHSPWISWDELVGARPDVIVVFPCGFDLQRTESEFASLAGRPEWEPLRNIPTFLANGHQFFNRPGPRLVDSAMILSEILHPEVCGTRHERTAWMRYNGTQSSACVTD